MIVVAHRGDCLNHLENSWSAFEAAVELGVDRIELDVQQTADGELVVLHDATLERVSGSSGGVRNLSRGELGKVVLANGESLPFLDDVLAKFGQRVVFNVEIKDERPSATRKVGELVRRMGLQERVILSSFFWHQTEFAADLFPDIPRAVLWNWDSRRLNRSWTRSLGSVMARCRTRVFHPGVSMVSWFFVNLAWARDWEIIPWVRAQDERDLEVARRLWGGLADRGIAGLCTNRPGEMLAWLGRGNGLANP